MIRRITDNPIIVKHVRSRLRRAQVISQLVIVVVLSMLVLWMGMSGGSLSAVVPMLLGLQGVILLLLGTSQVGSAAVGARDSGILDFHRASPLPAFDLALGFLLGAPIREYVLAAAVVPFGMMAALADIRLLPAYVLLLILLVTSTLVFHAIALVGGLAGGKRGNSGIGVVIAVHIFAPAMLGGLAFPAALTVVPAAMELLNIEGTAVGQQPRLFGVQAPIWVQSFFYQIPVFVLALLSCVRRMSSADRPIYSKTQGIFVLLVVGVLSLATFVNSGIDYLSQAGPVVLIYVLGFAAICLLVAITPWRGAWANGIRRAARMGRRRPLAIHDWASNTSIVVAYAAMVAGVSCYAFIVTLGVDQAFQKIGAWANQVTIVTLTVACFGWSLQYFHLRFGRVAVTFFGLFLFLAWIVPLLASGILTLNFESVAAIIRDLSPLAGIFSGSGIALVSSLVMTLIFGGLLLQTSALREARLHEELQKQDLA